MKRTLFSLIPAVLCTLALSLGLTGCGSAPAEAEAPAATCFVIANTANSQGLNLDSPAITNAALDTVSGFGFVSAVSVDGSPELLFAESFDIPAQYKKASKEKLQKDARANAAAVLQLLQGVRIGLLACRLDTQTDVIGSLVVLGAVGQQVHHLVCAGYHGEVVALPRPVGDVDVPDAAILDEVDLIFLLARRDGTCQHLDQFHDAHAIIAAVAFHLV